MIKEKSDVLVSIRLPSSLYDSIVLYSKRFGLSFSSAVKLILEGGVDRHENLPRA